MAQHGYNTYAVTAMCKKLNRFTRWLQKYILYTSTYLYPSTSVHTTLCLRHRHSVIATPVLVVDVNKIPRAWKQVLRRGYGRVWSYGTLHTATGLFIHTNIIYSESQKSRPTTNFFAIFSHRLSLFSMKFCPFIRNLYSTHMCHFRLIYLNIY